MQQALDEVINPSLSEAAKNQQNIKGAPEIDSLSYDLRYSTIYGFAPNAQGSNIVSGQTITDNTITGTENSYNNQNRNQSDISGSNEEVISLWKEKLASY